MLEDIGVWLKDRIIAHFKKAGKPLNLKYIGAYQGPRCCCSRDGVRRAFFRA